MSEYRGIAGCPQCMVPWTVEDWETYLSVKCPQCGRNIGEVAVRSGDGGGPFVILGQELPMGIPVQKSAVVGHAAPPRCRHCGDLITLEGDGTWRARDGYASWDERLHCDFAASRRHAPEGAEPDEAAEMAELHAYLAAAYPAPEKHGLRDWRHWWPLYAWCGFALALVMAALTLAAVMAPQH